MKKVASSKNLVEDQPWNGAFLVGMHSKRARLLA
jgi:hypothetical protein